MKQMKQIMGMLQLLQIEVETLKKAQQRKINIDKQTINEKQYP